MTRRRAQPLRDWPGLTPVRALLTESYRLQAILWDGRATVNDLPAVAAQLDRVQAALPAAIAAVQAGEAGT